MSYKSFATKEADPPPVNRGREFDYSQLPRGHQLIVDRVLDEQWNGPRPDAVAAFLRRYHGE